MLLRHEHHIPHIAASHVILRLCFIGVFRSLVHKRALCILTRPNAKPRASRGPTPWTQAPQKRGAKRTTVVRVDDLIQGAIGGSLSAHQDDDESDYSITLQEVQNNMLKFSHCVVLTRVGGFYEMYFEHADEFAPLLLLRKSTKRIAKGSTKPPVSMAGFPAYQLDRYLKILVQDMKKSVAVCEEFPNDEATRAKGDPMFTRKVNRVITPGTLIDEQFVDPWNNNYLLGIYVNPEILPSIEALRKNSDGVGSSASPLQEAQVGLAWIDLASGDFLTQTTDLMTLPTVVARIKPREIVLDSMFEKPEYSEFTKNLEDDDRTFTFRGVSSEHLSTKAWTTILEDVAGDISESEFSTEEMIAGGFLLLYVETQLVGLQASLRAPVKYHTNEHMSIDRHSLKALEIRTTLRDGLFEGSLLHSLKETVTKSGTRLLTQRLVSPSMSLSTINERLDFVQELIQHPQLREELIAYLRKSFDSLRLVTRFAYGRGDADDLVELAKTIDITAAISDLLEKHCAPRKANLSNVDPELPNVVKKSCLEALQGRFEMQQSISIARRVYAAIDEEQLSEYHRVENEVADQYSALAQNVVGREADEKDRKSLPKNIQAKRSIIAGSFKSATDGREDIYILQRTASPALRRLHKRLDSFVAAKDKLESRLREKLGAESLTLKWTPNLAHIGHVKGKDVNRTTTCYPRSLSSSKSTRTFQIPEWTQLGAHMNETRFNIRQEEKQVLSDLRKTVVRNLVKLRRNAAILDEIDVACAFANLAVKKHLVRPILTTNATHHIVGGRHPIVECGLLEQGRSFVPNDCLLGDAERIWLITGPNMAGKSTYLRQNVIISILAQTGSFVPAEYAEIGLVDKVFSRVGSADNLYQGQSTFLLEMLETAQILKEATSRSFVIMDEVGRGTTPQDGTAVSYAALHHLYHVNRCRTLFATHFHALADMTKDFEKLGYYCNDVYEQHDGSFSYVHRLKRGVNRESHALKVARMAGLPESAIAIAADVLKTIKPSGSA